MTGDRYLNVRRVVRAKHAGRIVERLLCNGALREMRRSDVRYRSRSSDSIGAAVFIASASTLVGVWIGALFLTGLL